MPSALVEEFVEAALVRLLRGDLVNAETELPNHHQTCWLMNLLSETVPFAYIIAVPSKVQLFGRPADELS